jgi:hypothetical protein
MPSDGSKSAVPAASVWLKGEISVAIVERDCGLIAAASGRSRGQFHSGHHHFLIEVAQGLRVSRLKAR